MEMPKDLKSNEVPLEPAECELVRTLIHQIELTQVRLRGVLEMKVKQCKLDGVWDLSPCGTKLVKQG